MGCVSLEQIAAMLVANQRILTRARSGGASAVSVLLPVGGSPSPAAGPVIPELRRWRQPDVRRGERAVLRDLVLRQLQLALRAAPDRAHRADRHRRRHRDGDRVRGGAARATSYGWFETPFSLFAAFLYTIPSAGVLRAHGAGHRHQPVHRRDRAGLLHAAHPVPQHPHRAARACRPTRSRPRRRWGSPAARRLLAGRAAAGPAGDHGRAPDRHRDDDQPGHCGRLHRRRRARRADLRRDPERLQDRVHRGRRAGDRCWRWWPTRCWSWLQRADHSVEPAGGGREHADAHRLVHVLRRPSRA